MMSLVMFDIQTHVVPCQYIREYPRATAKDQEDTLHLQVKQYVPKDHCQTPRAVTVIAAHANGFPKELYEPLFEELLVQSKQCGFTIRGIWIADMVNQGMSGALNENKLGNDPSWYDHSRDLLHMMNHFRNQMPRPIVGIGHSMGGTHLVNLSLMHPRLLITLILLDPVISERLPSPASGYGRPAIARASTFRRDIWPSRADAVEYFTKSKFYQSWDKRVLDRWLQYGLRDLPTAIHPQSSENGISSTGTPVTLTTTKHQEVFIFARPSFDARDPTENHVINRSTHPDLDAKDPATYPFYRPEVSRTFFNLPFLRPSALYIFGGMSSMSTPEERKRKLALTGVGLGGSGGAKEGRVKEVVLEGVGHLVAMEAVADSAHECAEWLSQELARWSREEEEFKREWDKKSNIQKMTVDARWKEMIVGEAVRPKTKKPAKQVPSSKI